MEVDGMVVGISFYKEQEELLKQIEEKNRKKEMEETRSLKLIQQLSIEEDFRRATSSGSSNRTNHQSSASSCTSSSLLNPQEMNGSWTKVAKTVRFPSGTPNQEKARKEQKEVEERERQREDWRREMREKEERERANIVRSHLDGQKVRMIKSPAVTSATSVAPVQALRLGDIAPSSGRRQKAAPGQKITPRSQRQAEVSEFEAERRKAATEMKRRIDDQVILMYSNMNALFFSL